MLKLQVLARFKHSSLSIELGWQNYAKKKSRYMSNPSIYCWRLILILMFYVSGISNQSFADACSSVNTRLPLQVLARFKHSSLSIELGWQNYAKKKRYMSNPSINC
jgi:hypothetical protein